MTKNITENPQPLRHRLPLRVTLIAALLLLVGFGLFSSAVVVTSVMQNSLISRIDDQLVDASKGWVQGPREFRTGKDSDEKTSEEPNELRPPSAFFVRSITADGFAHGPPYSGNNIPELPTDLNVGPRPVTIASVDPQGPRWRAVTVKNLFGTTVVALDMSSVDSTVNQLIWLESGVGTVVLVLLGGLGYIIVRRSLRPLEEVEQTAAAIAAGDLHKRVPSWGEKTEVGRLSVALNGMLTQIQTAFSATAASEEAAKQSEDNMRRFVADASHELRTPLTTIRGFSELYRQGATTDIDLLMNRIEGEAKRMGVLVEDLLMLARLDARRPLEKNPVDLLALATDAVHNAQAIAPERDISLEILAGKGTLEIIGDEIRLRQVLSNLVTNALRHTPEEAKITIRLGAQQDSEEKAEKSWVLLEVADTGPGLSESDAQRVFERFYRTDNSRTRESGGTGLGLSIVSALVQAHGGQVTVDTELGKGATFRVLLPVKPDSIGLITGANYFHS